MQGTFEIFYFCIHKQELNNDTDETGKARPFSDTLDNENFVNI